MLLGRGTETESRKYLIGKTSSVITVGKGAITYPILFLESDHFVLLLSGWSRVIAYPILFLEGDRFVLLLSGWSRAIADQIFLP